jgi:hypothetical protein
MHDNFKFENKEASVTEVAKLMAKIQRLHERELRAERQAQAVATERSAKTRRLNEEVRV